MGWRKRTIKPEKQRRRCEVCGRVSMEPLIAPEALEAEIARLQEKLAKEEKRLDRLREKLDRKRALVPAMAEVHAVVQAAE